MHAARMRPAREFNLETVHRESHFLQHRAAFRFTAVLASAIAHGEYGTHTLTIAEHRQGIHIRQQQLFADPPLTQRGINRRQRVAKRHHCRAIDKRALDRCHFHPIDDHRVGISQRVIPYRRLVLRASAFAHRNMNRTRLPV